MDRSTSSPAFPVRPAGRARLHRHRARRLFRWAIALPLALGFALVALNAALVPAGVDLVALRDAARVLIAVPLVLAFALGCAYVTKM